MVSCLRNSYPVQCSLVRYQGPSTSKHPHYGRELTENERDFLLLLSRLVSGCLDPSFSRRCKNKMSNFFLSDRKGSQANSRKRQVNSSKVRLQVLTEMQYQSISVVFFSVQEVPLNCLGLFLQSYIHKFSFTWSDARFLCFQFSGSRNKKPKGKQSFKKTDYIDEDELASESDVTR